MNTVTKASSIAVLALGVAWTTYAQHPSAGSHGMGMSHATHGSSVPRANQGHVPPAPVARPHANAIPEAEVDERGRANAHPHVNHDTWYGHDSPEDPRYRLPPGSARSFDRVGPRFRYPIARFDRDHHRFWLPGGFFFAVADWDWFTCADWCWDCGDDFVVYPDPDHPGWYLLYNVHTGLYVHVQYLGY